MHSVAETPPGGAGGLGLDRLREALRSPDPTDRAAALLHARFEPGLEQVLIGALDDADAGVRRAAVRALVRLQGPRGVRALVRVAGGDPSPAVRLEAVAALGRILQTRLAPGR